MGLVSLKTLNIISSFDVNIFSFVKDYFKKATEKRYIHPNPLVLQTDVHIFRFINPSEMHNRMPFHFAYTCILFIQLKLHNRFTNMYTSKYQRSVLSMYTQYCKCVQQWMIKSITAIAQITTCTNSRFFFRGGGQSEG